jgi:hypothetical protein
MDTKGGREIEVTVEWIWPTATGNWTATWGGHTAPEQKWAVGPSSPSGQTAWF